MSICGHVSGDWTPVNVTVYERFFFLVNNLHKVKVWCKLVAIFCESSANVHVIEGTDCGVTEFLSHLISIRLLSQGFQL
jgi:hypothetical protein